MFAHVGTCPTALEAHLPKAPFSNQADDDIVLHLGCWLMRGILSSGPDCFQFRATPDLNVTAVSSRLATSCCKGRQRTEEQIFTSSQLSHCELVPILSMAAGVCERPHARERSAFQFSARLSSRPLEHVKEQSVCGSQNGKNNCGVVSRNMKQAAL